MRQEQADNPTSGILTASPRLPQSTDISLSVPKLSVDCSAVPSFGGSDLFNWRKPKQWWTVSAAPPTAPRTIQCAQPKVPPKKRAQSARKQGLGWHERVQLARKLSMRGVKQPPKTVAQNYLVDREFSNKYDTFKEYSTTKRPQTACCVGSPPTSPTARGPQRPATAGANLFRSPPGSPSASAVDLSKQMDAQHADWIRDRDSGPDCLVSIITAQPASPTNLQLKSEMSAVELDEGSSMNQSAASIPSQTVPDAQQLVEETSGTICDGIEAADWFRGQPATSGSDAAIAGWFRGQPVSAVNDPATVNWFKRQPVSTVSDPDSVDWFRGQRVSAVNDPATVDWFRGQPAFTAADAEIAVWFRGRPGADATHKRLSLQEFEPDTTQEIDPEAMEWFQDQCGMEEDEDCEHNSFYNNIATPHFYNGNDVVSTSLAPIKEV